MRAPTISVALAFLTFGCTETIEQEPDVPDVDYENRVFAGNVDWEEAKKILTSCELIAVFQGHDRSIDMTLSDQRYYTSVQPSIDQFSQVMKEMQPCDSEKDGGRFITIVTE